VKPQLPGVFFICLQDGYHFVAIFWTSQKETTSANKFKLAKKTDLFLVADILLLQKDDANCPSSTFQLCNLIHQGALHPWPNATPKRKQKTSF